MNNSLKIIFSLSALFIGAGFIFIADGIIVSSVSILLKNLGANGTQIGLVTGCFFAGAIACTLVTHRLISSVGHVRSYAIFTAFFAISSLLHNFSENLIFWAFLRFILGFCYYSLVMIIESWLNSRTINQVRSRVLAIYEIVFYASFGIGTLLISFEFGTNFIFMFGTIFVILGLIPLNFMNVKSPPVPQKSRISIPNIFKIAPLALVTSIVSGLLMNGFFAMAPLFAIAQGLNSAQAAQIVVAGMCGGFSAHMIFGFISDKLGRKFAITLAAFIAFLISTIFILTKPGLILEYVLIFFLGCIFVLYALALARANDVAKDKRECVEINRTQLFNYLLGSFFASPILGFLINFFGAMGFMYFYAVLSLFLTIFALFQKSVPNADISIHSGGHVAVFGEKNDNN